MSSTLSYYDEAAAEDVAGVPVLEPLQVLSFENDVTVYPAGTAWA